MIDPERGIDQAIADYRRLGYSEAWITRRIKTIEIRKGLTKENLRDNMTNMELLLLVQYRPSCLARQKVVVINFPC